VALVLVVEASEAWMGSAELAAVERTIGQLDLAHTMRRSPRAGSTR